MKIGSTPITDIKVGSTQITKVIKDGVIYWELDSSWSAPFEFELTTINANQSITLPHLNGYTYNYTVDYGDGKEPKTVSSYNDANCTNVYAVGGIYIVKISGVCEAFCVDNNRSAGSIRLLITKVLSFGNIHIKKLNFYYCSNLTIIPSDINGGLSFATDLSYFVGDCPLITEIPAGIFDKCPLVTTFYSAFCQLASVTEIPIGLFDHNPLVTDFASTFMTFLSMTSIPAGLFDHNPLVTTFYYTFDCCSNLLSIPVGLFDHNPLVTNFNGVFGSTNSLISIPVGLFDNNLIVTDFDMAFFNSNVLVGNAPELWKRNPTPTGVSCFFADTNLTNYSDIPPDWKLLSPIILTIGGLTGDFQTLKQAFDYINDGGVEGHAVLKIIEDTVETETAELIAGYEINYSSITIYPINSGLIIGGNIAGDLIKFNNTQNVHINGKYRYNGDNLLTIRNDSNDVLANAIHYIGVTDTDVLYCTVIGNVLTE